MPCDMARPIRINVKLVAKATETVKTTESLDEFRSALSVLLPAKVGLSLKTTAELLGVGIASINRRQSRLLHGRNAKSENRNWGGRRYSLLTLDEEVEFLRPWAEKAKDAGLLVLSPIRAALSERVGHPVKASVVWRLLERHGWRKVAPDTRHPKNDPKVMAAWKKNSRKRWQPCCDERM
jgi:transposase